MRLGQGPPSPPEKDGSDDDYQESDEEEDGDGGPGGHGGGRKKRKSEKTPMGGPPGPTAAPDLRDNAPVEGYENVVNYEEMPASGEVDRLLLATEEKKDETMGCPEANTAKEQELRARPEENANEPNASRDVDESVTEESREQDRSECVGFPGEQERRSRSQDRGGHDASGSGDRFGCILMMTSGVEHDLPPDASVATKLSSLSQRLSLLRRSLHGDYDSCGCSSGRRSSSRRVAMLCGSYSGQSQGQSACHVGVVQEMWPEDGGR